MKSELSVIHIKWQPAPLENLVTRTPVKNGKKLGNVEGLVDGLSLRRAYTPSRLRRLDRLQSKSSIEFRKEAI